MTIKKMLTCSGVLLGIAALTLVVSLEVVVTNNNAINESQRVRLESMSLADELKESSRSDGYTLFSLIRSMEKHKETPIVFLTSNATTEYLSTAIKMGVSGFIKKPFEKDTLLEKIDSCLEIPC